MRIMLETCSKIVQRIALFICPQTGIITLILYIIKKPILIVLALFCESWLDFLRRGSGIRTHDPLLPKQNDKENYLVTYQLVAMMRANHFKDSSKNAVLRASFWPFLTYNSREQFLAFEHYFLAMLSGAAPGAMWLFCLFLPYLISLTLLLSNMYLWENYNLNRWILFAKIITPCKPYIILLFIRIVPIWNIYMLCRQ